MCNTTSLNESLDVGAAILIRCFCIGVIMMFFWLGFLLFAGDLTYRMHSQTIPLSREQFNCLHYGAFIITKTVIVMLFLAPYVAIKLVLRRRRHR